MRGILVDASIHVEVKFRAQKNSLDGKSYSILIKEKLNFLLFGLGACITSQFRFDYRSAHSICFVGFPSACQFQNRLRNYQQNSHALVYIFQSLPKKVIDVHDKVCSRTHLRLKKFPFICVFSLDSSALSRFKESLFLFSYLFHVQEDFLSFLCAILVSPRAFHWTLSSFLFLWIRHLVSSESAVPFKCVKALII